ncbi:MAG: DinB family protein [Planctomycetota bacterium]
MDIQRVRESSADYFRRYIDMVPAGDIIELLDRQPADVDALFRSIPPDRQTYRYAEGKWTPREILGHLIDCERVFQYRALRFARADQTPLPGFEENDYVPATDFNARSLDELLSEFRAVRASGQFMFRGLTEAERWRSGTANGQKLSVYAIMFLNVGHVIHHLGVIRERYLA